MICPTCRRDITSNWELHTITCSRHTFYCQQCDTALSRDQESKHVAGHETVKCACGEEIEQRYLDEHSSESIKHQQVECSFCDWTVFRYELADHEKECGSRTEKCSDCQKWVQIRHRDAHKCKQPINRVAETFHICPFCSIPNEDDVELQEHIFLEHEHLIY